MICKECGAYNPDHATYCKVCAANLKGEPEAEAAETPVVEDPQPTKRFSRPSWVVPEQAKKPEKVVKEVKEDVKEAEYAVGKSYGQYLLLGLAFVVGVRHLGLERS